MQTYTAQNLLNELTGQGVLVQPTETGNLFLDGELSDAQFSAIKELKPEIINLLNSRVYRFGTNEHLFFNLDSAFREFDVSSDAANGFFFALIERNENDDPNDPRLFISGDEIIFNQPSIYAYKNELKVCAGVRSGEFPAKIFNEFIDTHAAGGSLGEWMQGKDAPLWQVNIFDGGKIIESAACNSIQTAILCGYWSAKNPEVRHEITRA